MKDSGKTKEQLINELVELRQRITELEALEIQHKQVEKALRKSGEKYRLISESTSDLIEIATFDLNLTYTYISPSHKKVMGYEPEDLIGKSGFQFIHPDDKKKLLPLLKKYISKKTKKLFTEKDLDVSETIEYRARDKSGNWHYLQSTANIIGNELLFISRDITERRLSEQKLLESEKRFADIAGNALEWIWEIDTDGKYTYATHVVEKILGYRPEEVLKKHFYDLFHPGDRERLKKAAFEVFAKKQSFREFLNRNVHKDGKTVWLSTSGVPILDEKGHLLGYRGADTDITELKRAEEVIRESEERYRSVFENTGTATVIIEEDMTISMANTEYEKLTGYTKQEVEGKMKWAENAVEEDRERMKEYHVKRREKEEEAPTEYEFRLVDKHGNIKDIFVMGGMIPGTKRSVASLMDITPRKQAEEALRESEEKYRSLVESTEDSVYLVDSNCRYLFMNKKYLSRFHLPIDKVIGRAYGKFHSEQETKEFAKVVKEVFETGKSLWYEHRSRRDGRYFLRTFSTVKEPEERIIAVTVISKEITDRKQMEEALRESEAQYRGIFNSATDSFLIFDLDGNIVEANPKACKMYGYPYEELIKLSGKDIVHPKYYHLFEQFKRDVQTIGEFHAESVDVRKDGSIFNIEVEGSIFDYKGKPHLLAVIRDITKRKQAEGALKQAESRYRSLFEGVPTGLYRTTPKGEIVDVNQTTVYMLGYPDKEAFMRINASDLYANAEDRQRWQAMMERDRVVRGFEVQFRRYDGTIIWVQETARIVRDADGRVIYYEGSLEDVTEEKKAEEEKQNLQSQLQQAQKMEAIGTLAGGIAHNFNNLLMSIQGNTSLMLLDTEPNHPHYERLTNIEKLVQSGSKLTSQLLGYARGGRYELTPISMNQIIEETSTTFSMTKKDITIHKDLDKDLYGVKADLGQIEQILLNIYVNAAEAMPGGGDLFLKTINITHKDIKRKPYKVKPGEYVLLTVRDTGIGMDKKTTERIFDPFFTTKGLAKGTGLGLASVYGIIKAHGGYIDVESKKGQGTTFYVYLPANKAEDIAQRAEAERGIEILQGKETALLVDDEDMVLDVGQDLLKSLGYKVLIAKGGKEALEIYEKNKEKIDIVILDMIMPVIGGGEAYDRMKEINPDIKVLLSSGYSINGQATEILRRGCDGFIQKPFTMIFNTPSACGGVAA